jgi:hypothetical protein
MSVTSLTLRNLSGDLLRVLEETAIKNGTSLTRAALLLLEKGAGLRPERGPQRQHWYDQFAGSWTAEEAAEFDAALAEQRKIDPEIWS